MKSKDVKWLPHLENSIPKSIGGYALSFYSVALEGWRRGLTLKFINTKQKKARTVFELSSKQRTHKFTASRGDLVSLEGIKACVNKDKTKQYLEAANVPTPKGKRFSRDSEDVKLIEFANKLGYPLVLKPTSGHAGKGVVSGIKDEDELKKALNYVRVDLGLKRVIIEEYFDGEDYRVYVVGDKVVAVTKRVPANVQGDGKSTIQQLIETKNKVRQESPILGSSLIKVDQELKDMINIKDYTLESIPNNDEIVYLKSKNNISAGGDPSDVTDELSDSLKQIAVDAVKALPNVAQAGVDLLVNLKTEAAVVIEINSQPSIRTHLFPMHGQGRDVPKEIIDYYFPETKGKYISSKFNFDFDPIWDVFRQGIADEIVIPDIPTGNIKLTRFLINDVLDYIDYGDFVRDLANQLNLQGYVKRLSKNRVAIIIAGEQSNVTVFKNNLTKGSTLDIVEKKRISPVEIGFKVI